MVKSSLNLEEQPLKKVVFLHGFVSGGRCEPAQVLAEGLKGCAEVISPDLPLHPREAIAFVKELCCKEKPDLIVGISCGSFYGQQVATMLGIPALLINPFLIMTDFLKPRMGVMKYNNPRYDGVQEFEVTPALVQEYAEVEEHQFDGYKESNRNRIWGLFGKQDNLAHYRDLFSKYYSETRDFDGGHAIEKENVTKALVPMVKEMLEKVHPCSATLC